jgi:hypothetical protein
VIYFTRPGGGSVNFQATLSAVSAFSPLEAGCPHHPITCQSGLRYEEDGTFSCEHTSVPAGDVRTQFCIDHSMAVLLIELAMGL